MYLDQRHFWIWLVWNTENSICPSWKLHLFIFVEEWAKHSSRQLELGSDGDSVFRLWGDRVLRFCFFTAFVSFLIADKIAEERTSGRKGLWAHRYGVSAMSGGMAGGAWWRQLLYLSAATGVWHIASCQEVRRQRGCFSPFVHLFFSFYVWLYCVVHMHHTVAEEIEVPIYKMGLLPL